MSAAPTARRRARGAVAALLVGAGVTAVAACSKGDDPASGAGSTVSWAKPRATGLDTSGTAGGTTPGGTGTSVTTKPGTSGGGLPSTTTLRSSTTTAKPTTTTAKPTTTTAKPTTTTARATTTSK